MSGLVLCLCFVLPRGREVLDLMRNSLANHHDGRQDSALSRTPSHNLVLRDVLRTGVFVRPSDIKIDSVSAAAGGGRRRAQAGETVVVIFHVEAP